MGSCFNAGTTWKPGIGVACFNCGAKAQTVTYEGETLGSREQVWECSKTHHYIAEYGAGYSVVPKERGGQGKKRSRRLK